MSYNTHVTAVLWDSLVIRERFQYNNVIYDHELKGVTAD